MAQQPQRPQAHRLTWPLTPSQVEGLDNMLQSLFRSVRALTDTGGSGTADLTNLNATNLTSGTVPDARLNTTAVTPATYGDATHVGQFTVDSHGRLTAASSVAITGGSGKLAQVVNTQTGAVATGTTAIPHDDTIPQNTEGDQYMSLAITPTSATNKLKIDVVLFAGATNASQWMTAALFQDTTANALAAGMVFDATATAGLCIVFTHYMTAGTTSATTFKVRAGRDGAGTTTFNGQSGGRMLGGVLASSITISEIVP